MSEHLETDYQWLRLHHIIGDAEASPPVPALVPVSKSTIYRWIRDGVFPAPVKPTSATSLWRAAQVLETLESWRNDDGI